MIEVGQRKLLTGAVLLLTGITVTFFKGDIPPNLLSLLQMLYFAFIAGNGIEHMSTILNNNKKDNK